MRRTLRINGKAEDGKKDGKKKDAKKRDGKKKDGKIKDHGKKKDGKKKLDGKTDIAGNTCDLAGPTRKECVIPIAVMILWKRRTLKSTKHGQSSDYL